MLTPTLGLIILAGALGLTATALVVAARFTRPRLEPARSPAPWRSRHPDGSDA